MGTVETCLRFDDCVLCIVIDHDRFVAELVAGQGRIVFVVIIEPLRRQRQSAAYHTAVAVGQFTQCVPLFRAAHVVDERVLVAGGSDESHGLVIDAGSEEVMLRIEASMSKLKVMGDDDRRFFWIWAQVNKREREWLQVLTAHYNDFHYLILSDNRSKMAVLQNAESTTSNKEKYREDMKEYLLTLEAHVNAVVDWILRGL